MSDLLYDMRKEIRKSCWQIHWWVLHWAECPGWPDLVSDLRVWWGWVCAASVHCDPDLFPAHAAPRPNEAGQHPEAGAGRPLDRGRGRQHDTWGRHRAVGGLGADSHPPGRHQASRAARKGHRQRRVQQVTVTLQASVSLPASDELR